MIRFERANVTNGNINNPTDLPNPLLGPGITDELEVILNLEFLNRFTFLASYSEQINRNQILDIPLSAITGRSVQRQNAGTLETNTISLVIPLSERTI